MHTAQQVDHHGRWTRRLGVQRRDFSTNKMLTLFPRHSGPSAVQSPPPRRRARVCYLSPVAHL